jgi:hypothetical protein
MQQIQCIDQESREQPNFSQRPFGMWKQAAAQIHQAPVSDSRQSTFSDGALWKS